MKPAEVKLKRYLTRHVTFLTQDELALIRYLGLLLKEYAELVVEDYSVKNDAKKTF